MVIPAFAFKTSRNGKRAGQILSRQLHDPTREGSKLFTHQNAHPIPTTPSQCRRPDRPTEILENGSRFLERDLPAGTLPTEAGFFEICVIPYHDLL